MINVVVNLIAVILVGHALYSLGLWVYRGRRRDHRERHVLSVMVGDLVLMRAEIVGEVITLERAPEGAVSNALVAGRTWIAPDGQLMMTFRSSILHLTK